MSRFLRLLYGLCIVAGVTGCQTIADSSASTCNPLGLDKESLLVLKAAEFIIPDAPRRHSFALELVSCLGDPDPQIRDGIAYEAFVTLLRGKQLDSATIVKLRDELLELLEPEPDDREGFRRPFAALALAEVARADRVEKIFTDEQRAELVNGATAYMLGITDYRGFDETEGWRHGVAHCADLLMQLTLNPAVTSAQLSDIADAVAVQVAPRGEHAYIFGEYERLARPVYYIAMRGDLSDQQWADWFAALASPAPFTAWSEVWTSRAGLAKLHNTKVFAETIHLYATTSDAEQLKPLAAGALTVLKALN